MKKTYNPGDIVTVQFEHSTGSNTFLVDSDHGDYLFVTHPLTPRCFIRLYKDSVDQVPAKSIDSSERALYFIKSNLSFLDLSIISDFEALCLYFVMNRRFTKTQKATISKICGIIAATKLNDSVEDAIQVIKNHVPILDEFNRMWYYNFFPIFEGTQPIRNNKQKIAMFNMAGFILSELSNATSEIIF